MEGLWWVCRFNRFRCILNEKHITLFIFSGCRQAKIWYSPNDLYTFPWSFPFSYHRLHGFQMIYTLHRQNQRFFFTKNNLSFMVWNQMISCVFSSFFIHYIQSNYYNLPLNTNQFVVFSSFFLLFFNAVQQTFFNNWTSSVCSTDYAVSYGFKLELPTSTLNSVCVTNAYFSWKIGQTCWKLKFANFFWRPIKCDAESALPTLS